MEFIDWLRWWANLLAISLQRSVQNTKHLTNAESVERVEKKSVAHRPLSDLKETGNIVGHFGTQLWSKKNLCPFGSDVTSS